MFLRLPHTSRFFVVELQILCRGQIGLKFVGPSACRTLAEFLSRLTASRLGAGSFKIKMAPIPLTRLSWRFLIGWAARERRQVVLAHHTLADKARQDVWDLALSDFARQAPIWIHRTLADKWRFFVGRRPLVIQWTDSRMKACSIKDLHYSWYLKILSNCFRLKARTISSEISHITHNVKILNCTCIQCTITYT